MSRSDPEVYRVINLLNLDELPGLCSIVVEGTVKHGLTVRAQRADGRLSFPRPVTGKQLRWRDFVWQDEPTSFAPRRRLRWITRWYDRD